MGEWVVDLGECCFCRLPAPTVYFVVVVYFQLVFCFFFFFLLGLCLNYIPHNPNITHTSNTLRSRQHITLNPPPPHTSPHPTPHPYSTPTPVPPRPGVRSQVDPEQDRQPLRVSQHGRTALVVSQALDMHSNSTSDNFLRVYIYIYIYI